MELFKNITGTSIVSVPYRGGGPGQVGLLAGEVDAGFNNIVAAVPLIKVGKVRPLAISSAARSSVLHEMPTVAEAGVPGYTFTTWYGALAPAATPPVVISILNDHIVKAVRGADLAKRFAYEGAEAIASPPARLAEHNKAELARWEKVVRESESLRGD